MTAPYTAEELAAIRRVAEEEPMMGLGARRLLATIDALSAERDALREAAAAALASLNGGRCRRCHGHGRIDPPCPWCGDSTYDHICPSSKPCEACDGKGYKAPVLALRALLEAP